ncbi:M28 family peptidase, partial [Arthrospira platensis SPKY1]|nr:M28 family peptidase [Arthrospira platensis SPKY1]
MNHFKKFILAFLISLPLFAQVTNKETLFQHVSFLASDTLEGRGLGTKGKIIARDYIVHHFDQIGLKKWNDVRIQEFPVKAGIAWVEGHNVLGVIEGTDSNLRNEFIVIGAHYDHIGYRITDEGKKIIFPGADDNASGVV